MPGDAPSATRIANAQGTTSTVALGM